MKLLVLQAYWKLICFDFYLLRGNFPALREKVRGYPIGKPLGIPPMNERLTAAVDVACIWYWKEVLCLHRSATTTCLLRQYGVPAQMMIGAQQLPFKAHSWVEVDGVVVNDKPYMREMYAVLDYC